jgi:hypothetical protein
MDAAMDFLLQSSGIPGDPIAAGMSAALMGQDEAVLRNFAANNLTQLNYLRWNQTSLGNLLIMYKDHRDDLIGPAAADALRGYLHYARETGHRFQFMTADMERVYAYITDSKR